MKIFKFNDYINENISYAKAILRKKNIEPNNDNYKKILDITKSDGYTGLLTKLHFVDNIEINELEQLYNDLKDKKINVSSLLKKSYDEVLDEVYDDIDVENGIKIVGEYDKYIIFYIPTYEDGLEINSPSWCLKTKSMWDRYTNDRNGKNFVLIEKKYTKGLKTKLSTPNTYFGKYTNTQKPDIRIGITIYNINRYDAFDDDNKILFSIDNNILKICNEYLLNNDLLKLKKYNNEFDYDNLYDYIDSILERYNIREIPYSQLGYDYSINIEINKETFIKILNEEYSNNLTLKEFLVENKNEVLSSDIVSWCGAVDLILYYAYDESNDIELGGFLLKETEPIEMWYKYSYGFCDTYFGKLFILQSYQSIDKYYEDLSKYGIYSLIFNNVESSLSIDGPGIRESYTNFLNFISIENNKTDIQISIDIKDLISNYLESESIEISYMGSIVTSFNSFIDKYKNDFIEILDQFNIQGNFSEDNEQIYISLYKD